MSKASSGISTSMGKTLRAARRAVALGREVTVSQLMRISGLGEVAVRRSIGKLREAGQWEWPVEGWSSVEERWAGYEDQVLEVAAALADMDDGVMLSDVIRASGLGETVVRSAVQRLRNRNQWPYRKPRQPEPECHVDWNMADSIAGQDTRRCRDGRNEVDDPIRYAGLPPWSGRPVPPARVSYRNECRRYLKEWAEINQNRSM